MFRPVAVRAARRSVITKRCNSTIPPPHAGPSEAVSEDFGSPIWKNTLAFGVLAYAIYKFDEAYASSNDGMGYFTALIDHYRPKDGLWEARNLKHFNLATEAAETRRLMNDAEKPLIRQLRYPAALDHGSPWNTRVDHLVDNSKVKVRTRNEVATAGVEDSV